ncbi:MAG: hypothetical protein Q8L57_01360 [bacterium]|nr:hypothetical protein [bacterium]
MSFQEETINNLTGEIEKFPNFSGEEKAVWKERVKIVPPEYALFLLDLFENSPEDVLFLNQNIKDKEKILEGRDEKGWRDLLEAEKKMLEKLANQ